MKALFVELPAFERFRAAYLDDGAFAELQQLLRKDPEAGDVIEGTGGLRKIRFADKRRGKGKRGGLRVVYYWWRRNAVLAVHAVRQRRSCGPYREAEEGFEGDA